MTKRERALAVLRGETPDVIPWFGDLSYWIGYMNSAGKLAPEYQEDGLYRLHRDIGVGFYLQGYWPVKGIPAADVDVVQRSEGPLRIREVRTPVGTLREVWKYLPETYSTGPVEHFIKSVEDLRILRYWIAGLRYVADYALAEKRVRLIGDNGLNLCYLPRSPFMELMVNFAGVEALTYALYDDPAEVEETLALMETQFDRAALIALDSPAECLMIPENLSAENLGPDLQRRFLYPFEKKWTATKNSSAVSKI